MLNYHSSGCQNWWVASSLHRENNVEGLVDWDYVSFGEISATKQAVVILKSKKLKSANLVVLTGS